MQGISDEKKKFGQILPVSIRSWKGALGIQSAGRHAAQTTTYHERSQAGGESPPSSPSQRPAHTKFCAWLIPVPLAWGGGPAAIVSWILAS